MLTNCDLAVSGRECRQARVIRRSLRATLRLVTRTRAGALKIDEQFPEWRSLPVRSLATHGTVNAIFRIGDRLAARFPLVSGDAESTRHWLESEAEAARELAGRTRFRTPEPVALGEPRAGCPLPWSVQTWLPGVVATDEQPDESIAFAHDLAELIGELRAIDTRGRTFAGSGRGGDLREHDGWMETCFDGYLGLLTSSRRSELDDLVRHVRHVDPAFKAWCAGGRARVLGRR
jgi:aminoglycoside phosphotransferase (APT) family kinase protein